jgi:hypothetical protein
MAALSSTRHAPSPSGMNGVPTGHLDIFMVLNHIEHNDRYGYGVPDDHRG